jgi:hypothetical protein
MDKNIQGIWSQGWNQALMRIKDISLLTIKQARTRLKLFFEVKERLLGKDFQNQEEGTTQKGRTRTKKQ